MEKVQDNVTKQYPTAILIGEESLATICGDYLLSQKWNIVCVVSNNPKIQQWAREAKIAATANAVDLDWKAVAYDYLFSITNFSILPSGMVERASLGAFNFHDGPLPDMGGLNTPSWAILKGNTTHAVTWHKLSKGIDSGEVCIRRDMSINPQESIFELNARCFEFGFETFRELVTGIVSHTGPSSHETPVLEYFARDLKPKNLGYIDQQTTAVTAQRLLLALSTNGFRNALASVKIAVSGSSYVVSQASVQTNLTAMTGPLAPGSYCQEGHQLCVKLADDAVLCIDVLLTLSGQTIALDGLPKSGTIETPNFETLNNENENPTLNESKWFSRYPNFQSIQSALISSSPDAQNRLATLIHLDAESGQRFVAIVALIAARLSGTEATDLVLRSPKTMDLNRHSLGYFSSSAPYRIPLNNSVADYIVHASKVVQQLGTNPTPSNDLAYRFPAHAQQVNALLYADLLVELIESRTALEMRYQRSGEVSPGIYYCLDTGEVVYAGAISVEHERNLVRYFKLADTFLSNSDSQVSSFELVDESDLALYAKTNRRIEQSSKFRPITEEIDAAAQVHGDRVAISHGGQNISFNELSKRSDTMSQHLRKAGLGDGKLVGVLIHRSVDAVLAMLAIMKAGSAYVPLDPDYPLERLRTICEQSKITHAFASTKTRSSHQILPLEFLAVDYTTSLATDTAERDSLTASDLAYVIYTSGSTGVPKGVMVEHGNVSNFLTGIDDRVGTTQMRNGQAVHGEFLSVTSISFDISVLELWWSLSRGLKVILFDDNLQLEAAGEIATRPFEFSLYYWNTASTQDNAQQDTYRLLLEGAKFADKNNFAAVWTPERHFGDFGGPYPNPAVTGAAVASVTNNIAVRAGSCVAPLHHPIRIAEEWAVVDNLCGGRAGISFASGWMPDDFVLAPDNFHNAKEVLAESIEQVKSLWRGDKLSFEGPQGTPLEVSSMPRPIQKELPVWLTSAGNIETFQQAGKSGYFLLTHLLGQTVNELGIKIQAYREAWKQAGHDGKPQVTLMLHTYVADTTDQAIEVSRKPMKSFLHTSLNLVKAAAWDFPTYQSFSDDGKRSVDEYFEQLDETELDDLLEFSFQRYAKDSGLIGSVDDCKTMLERISKIDVDELACLVDFGIDADTVLESLPKLNQLREANQRQKTPHVDLQSLCGAHNISHLQCTPSQASIFLLDPQVDTLFGQLDYLLVGGEAINQDLANTLCAKTNGEVINMYGPTETTVWSTVQKLSAGKPVSIGKPLKNQSIAVVDHGLRRVPVDTVGELLIGGLGVTRGYYGREDLTAERFIDLHGERFYRTGDLVRLERSGELNYIGRNDHQVKVRGYRIELREIENHLSTNPEIHQVAVHTEDDGWGGVVLVAYVVLEQGLEANNLRSFCKAKLPDFMIPNRFVQLSQLPMTPNGKIDYKALKHQSVPQVAVEANASDPAMQASSNSEKKLLSIWSLLLGVEVNNTNANFFDLGGHSILAVRMQGELDKVFGRRFAISDIFRYPTIKTFAGYIDAGAAPSTKAVKDGSKRAQLRRKLRQRNV